MSLASVEESLPQSWKEVKTAYACVSHFGSGAWQRSLLYRAGQPGEIVVGVFVRCFN